MHDLTIIQTCLYSIALALIFLSIYRYKKYKSLELWLEVPATIKSISEKDFSWGHQYSSTTLDFNYPLVEYFYSFKNEKYESSQVSLNLSNIWIHMASNEVTEKYNNRFWYTWKQGLKISAFVNPNNPKESVLIKEMSSNLKSTNITLIAAGILIAVFSYYASPYIATNLI